MSQIRIVYSKDGLREFRLLEAQGSLETDSDGGLCGQQELAEIERQGDKAVMQIGVHRVHGSVVKLKKPLAVLRRRPDSSSAGGDRDCDVQYDIEAVITEKMLFKARPDVVL
ncbi:Chromosome transmission fidelity protein 8 [Coemansia biformis]|uniref:Chromosome transmission fidelity protein 8 n=1 Tax=Coemansia biformis TaxID=1286918 RepID=A0A9W7YDC5_9FUNG|nr:Chromosome transmission fidelity protein 8 [Coemansia biformis]